MGFWKALFGAKPPARTPVSTLAGYSSKCPGCSGRIREGEEIAKAELTLPTGRTFTAWVCSRCFKSNWRP